MNPAPRFWTAASVLSCASPFAASAVMFTPSGDAPIATPAPEHAPSTPDIDGALLPAPPPALPMSTVLITADGLFERSSPARPRASSKESTAMVVAMPVTKPPWQNVKGFYEPTSALGNRKLNPLLDIDAFGSTMHRTRILDVKGQLGNGPVQQWKEMLRDRDVEKLQDRSWKMANYEPWSALPHPVTTVPRMAPLPASALLDRTRPVARPRQRASTETVASADGGGGGASSAKTSARSSARGSSSSTRSPRSAGGSFHHPLGGLERRKPEVQRTFPTFWGARQRERHEQSASQRPHFTTAQPLTAKEIHLRSLGLGRSGSEMAFHPRPKSAPPRTSIMATSASASVVSASASEIDNASVMEQPTVAVIATPVMAKRRKSVGYGPAYERRLTVKTRPAWRHLVPGYIEETITGANRGLNPLMDVNSFGSSHHHPLAGAKVRILDVKGELGARPVQRWKEMLRT